MATAWTTLMHNGDSGYRAYARAMGGVHARLKKEIAAIPGLRLMGNPDACVVAFTSDEFNIYVLADALSAKGWEVPRLQRPACIHFCVGGAALQKLKEDPTKTVVDKYLEDLKEAAATCMATRGEKGKVRVHACMRGWGFRDRARDVWPSVLTTCRRRKAWLASTAWQVPYRTEPL